MPPSDRELRQLMRMHAVTFRLSTPRLILAHFCADDAPSVQTLAGDYGVYRMTAQIPHPYFLHHAETWIAGHKKAYDSGQGITWAIRRAGEVGVIGCISFETALADGVATLGYWIGKPFWRQGFATEAARAVAIWASDAGFARIAAQCLKDNLASVRILQHLGLQREGCLRGHVFRDDRRQDVLLFGATTQEVSRCQKI